jgi:uroporphyrin-III C-methyltransferase
MGVSSAARIQQALLQGLPSQTPVAIIQHASLPEQRHAVCTLAELHYTLTAAQLGSPSVIVVGDVLQGLLAVAGAQTRAA